VVVVVDAAMVVDVVEVVDDELVVVDVVLVVVDVVLLVVEDVVLLLVELVVDVLLVVGGPPISQFAPEMPAGQTQKYPPKSAARQVPPLRHGLLG
jgi:hypothetical protein